MKMCDDQHRLLCIVQQIFNNFFVNQRTLRQITGWILFDKYIKDLGKIKKPNFQRNPTKQCFCVLCMFMMQLRTKWEHYMQM